MKVNERIKRDTIELYKQGIGTEKIAEYLRISEDEVKTILSKVING